VCDYLCIFWFLEKMPNIFFIGMILTGNGVKFNNLLMQSENVQLFRAKDAIQFHQQNCTELIPLSSIEYPGTRTFDQIFEYSNCRVIGSSNRVFTLALVSTSSVFSYFHYNLIFFNLKKSLIKIFWLHDALSTKKR